jgi:thiamine-phosphate diphosphorylase
VVDRAVPVATVAEAVAGGVDVVHLRDPSASAVELWHHGRRLAQVAPLVVNDRLDVALALGADGVQLSARSLPLQAARRVAPGLGLGVSIHSPDEAVDADWLLVGTIYATGSHPDRAGAGPGLIAEVRLRTDRPIIAIGGITPANAAEVMRAGANGVAVMSAILAAPAPRDAARRLADEVHRQR